MAITLESSFKWSKKIASYLRLWFFFGCYYLLQLEMWGFNPGRWSDFVSFMWPPYLVSEIFHSVLYLVYRRMAANCVYERKIEELSDQWTRAYLEMVDRLRQQSDELETLKKDVDKLKSELQASESEGGSEQEEVPSSPYGAGVLNSPNDLWEKLHSVAEYTHSKKGEDNQLAGKKDEWLAKQCEEGDSNRVEEHQKIEAVGKTKHGKVAEIQRQRELEVEEKEMLRREALAWPVPAATATKPTPGR